MENGRFAYDPWGKRRNPANWTQDDTRTNWIVSRGYTMHEHLDIFSIINMNGRVYDPLTAQFFSPDPTLTDVGNWLDYNRFGYCLNNPFRYTDPSGYTWWAENGNMVITTTASIVVGGVVAIATVGVGVPAMIASGMAAGAAGGFTGGALGTALAGGSFDDAMQAGLEGAAMGAVMGGVTAGIGSAFGPVGSIAKKTFDVWKELGRAGVHALAQGGFSAMRGGDFWQGAAAGFASSFVGSAAQGVGIHGLGMVGVSAASGGIGAAIAGGEAEDILYGMVSGAMVGMLNHEAGEKQKELATREKIGKLASSLGFSVEAKNAIIEWALKSGKTAGDIEKYLAVSKGLGKICGFTNIVVDYIEVIENPSTANKIRLGVDVLLFTAGPMTSAAAGLLEVSGLSDQIYNYLGYRFDDSMERLSNSYYYIQQFRNPVNWMPQY